LIREFAIVGPTASGKSSLAIELAEELNGYILSIDSLSIYKEFNIVSAKPTEEELNRVLHFGINELSPNELSSVQNFIKIYRDAKERAEQDGKNLIIVGGTSFYLKSLLSGLSKLPEIDESVKERVAKKLSDPVDAYNQLHIIDPIYAENIKSGDRYRVEKGWEIYLSTGEIPSIYFQKNPPEPIISADTPIYNIDIDRKFLRSKIRERTDKMIETGLLDEVKSVINKYGRDIQPIKAIGVKESVEYLDGEISDLEKLSYLVSTHTGQLAKRQQTFNRTQFKEFNIITEPIEVLRETILKG
jgi:tRNA dimethylallyltransferase